MKIEAWWFETKQKEREILQPAFFTPKTHYGIYAELNKIEFPVVISVSAYVQTSEIYSQKLVIENSSESNDRYEIECFNNAIIFKGFVNDVFKSPDEMVIRINTGKQEYIQTIHCEYVQLHGKISDFNNVPFSAAILLYRVAFDGKMSCMGAWSNKNGEYSVVVPKGTYNAFYVDDESYGKTSLENWSWHMIVDKDEEHNFKIGNGEVYSLSLWPNNGGSSTLYLYFRPMILPSIKSEEYEIDMNGQKRSVTDISPELELCDLRVMLNGINLEIISLQKIYETSNNYTMPAYIIQTKRWVDNLSTIGKQTVIVEYDTNRRLGSLNYIAQSQGRMQFFYKDVYGLTLM